MCQAIFHPQTHPFITRTWWGRVVNTVHCLYSNPCYYFLLICKVLLLFKLLSSYHPVLGTWFCSLPRGKCWIVWTSDGSHHQQLVSGVMLPHLSQWGTKEGKVAWVGMEGQGRFPQWQKKKHVRRDIPLPYFGCCALWMFAWNFYSCEGSQQREEARAKRSRGRPPGPWHTCALTVLWDWTCHDC